MKKFIGLFLIQGNADIKDRITTPRQWTNEPTKKWGQVSIDGWTRIIKDNKATCLIKKVVSKHNGKTTERTNSVSVSDFVQLTRHTEWYHTNTGSKKNVKDFKCKKKKK